MLDIFTHNQKMKARFQLPHFTGQSPERESFAKVIEKLREKTEPPGAI